MPLRVFCAEKGQMTEFLDYASVMDDVDTCCDFSILPTYTQCLNSIESSNHSGYRRTGHHPKSQ